MQTIILLVLTVTIVQIILGSVWYSPVLFGKVWMKINGVANKSAKEIKEMQKQMLPAYGLQFLATFITNFALVFMLSSFGVDNLIGLFLISGILWAGFIMPTQASEVLWGNLSNKMKLQKFLISTSYQFICIAIATYIYSIWG
jgi:hypothetical protein